MQADNEAAFHNATQHLLDVHGFFAGHPADSTEARLQQLQALRPDDMEPEAIAEYLEALRSHKAEVCFEGLTFLKAPTLYLLVPWFKALEVVRL